MIEVLNEQVYNGVMRPSYPSRVGPRVMAEVGAGVQKTKGFDVHDPLLRKIQTM